MAEFIDTDKQKINEAPRQYNMHAFTILQKENHSADISHEIRHCVLGRKLSIGNGLYTIACNHLQCFLALTP